MNERDAMHTTTDRKTFLGGLAAFAAAGWAFGLRSVGLSIPKPVEAKAEPTAPAQPRMQINPPAQSVKRRG